MTITGAEVISVTLTGSFQKISCLPGAVPIRAIARSRGAGGAAAPSLLKVGMRRTPSFVGAPPLFEENGIEYIEKQ